MNTKLTTALLLTSMLAGCATSPPIDSSRQMLWEKFGNQPIDNLLLAWGPPVGETRLTNGERLVTYTYTDIYDFNAWNQSAYSCKATFLAPPPAFKIASVTLAGEDYECQQLAEGHTGIASYVSPRSSFFFGTFRDY